MKNTLAAMMFGILLVSTSPAHADNQPPGNAEILNTPEARAILEDMKSLQEQMRPLRERMAADLRKLKELGVDLKALHKQIGGGPVSVK